MYRRVQPNFWSGNSLQNYCLRTGHTDRLFFCWLWFLAYAKHVFVSRGKMFFSLMITALSLFTYSVRDNQVKNNKIKIKKTSSPSCRINWRNEIINITSLKNKPIYQVVRRTSFGSFFQINAALNIANNKGHWFFHSKTKNIYAHSASTSPGLSLIRCVIVHIHHEFLKVVEVIPRRINCFLSSTLIRVFFSSCCQLPG